jgi:hypothetical protein
MPSTGVLNAVFPPTLLLEYAGTIPSRRLPRLGHPSGGDAASVGKWIDESWDQCGRVYNDRLLNRLERQTQKTVRRKIGEVRRSETSRNILRAARKRWNRDRRLFKAILRQVLILNVMTSHDHLEEARKDAHWHMLMELLNLWNNGYPFPFLKLAHRICFHLTELAEEQGADPNGGDWPDQEKIAHLKPMDLGDAEYLTYAVVGFPIAPGEVVKVDIFTSDPREVTVERLRMCKAIFRAFHELFVEKGRADLIKFVPQPGVVHFFNQGRFEALVDVGTL